MNPADPIICKLQSAPIDLIKIRQDLMFDYSVGGLTTFEGIIRDSNHGKKVTKLEYEVYEALALTEMCRIGSEAVEKFNLALTCQIHRFGPLTLGDTAVFIAAASKHRNEAFVGCRYIIDQLKKRVPIWKKEFYSDNTHEWTRCHEMHEHH
jgi:molybdopterin synthase catalytic subunit